MKKQATKIQAIRDRLHEIIFEADTPAGKWFDILLILSILSSVLVVMLDSVTSFKTLYGVYFYFFDDHLDPGDHFWLCHVSD